MRRYCMNQPWLTTSDWPVRALDANEAESGPFYIQGDHTGGLKFRNITVSVPKK